MKNSIFLLLLTCLACGESPKLHLLGKLPSKLNETSACELVNGLIWTTEDHGNSPELFAIDKSGKLVHTLRISGVANNDWEELTSDTDKNLYIGDFGNNENKRQNLAIYKINAPTLSEDETTPSVITTFYYPDQKKFPPKKSERIFDCESFFALGNYFYLFSKNRSSGFDGTTILYRVPNMPGNFAAEKISEFQTCGNYNHCAVTSADISPDGKKVVLLSSDKIWIFEGFNGDDFFSGKATEIPLDDFSQKEGICFASNTELFITDEKEKKTGGNLYQFDLLLKTKP